MKNKYYISITDTRGTKSFSINKVIKTYLLVLLFIIVISIVTLVLLTLFFNVQIKKYSKIIDEKIRENAALYNDLEDSKKQFENINEKITIIEDLISDMEHIPVEDLSSQDKIELLQMDLQQKRFFLQVIPNGNPLEEFNGYTSGYGKRFHPVLKKEMFHFGLDFKAKIGINVLATSDGVVEFAGFNSGGYGNLIIITHNYGFKTYYAHLDKISVKIGDFVRKGQKIGNTGNSGRSTGPHLHYEVHHLGKKLNPINFVNWNLENYHSLFNKESKVKWQFLIEIITYQLQMFLEKK